MNAEPGRGSGEEEREGGSEGRGNILKSVNGARERERKNVARARTKGWSSQVLALDCTVTSVIVIRLSN